MTGRPRRAETDRAITDAARALLAEVGYTELTMEDVARRAGVGKPTLYRRHDSKAGLVAGVLRDSLAGANPTVPDTGDVAADLRTLLVNLCAAITGTDFGVAVAELVAPAQRDPAVAEAFGAVVDRRREVIRAVVQRADDHDRLRSSDVETAIDLALGGVYYRHLVERRALDDAFVDHVVATLVEPS